MKQLLILSSVAALFFTIIAVISLKNLRREVLSHSELYADSKSTHLSSALTSYFKEKQLILEQASRTTGSLYDASAEVRDAELYEFYRSFVIDYPEFLSIQLMLEETGFMGDGKVNSYHYFNEGENLLLEKNTLSKSDISQDDIHAKVRVTKSNYVSEVYSNNVWGENTPSLTYAVPIFYRGSFIGSLAAELSLHGLKTILESGEILLTNADKILYHPDNRYIATAFSDIITNEKLKESLSETPVFDKSWQWDFVKQHIQIIQPIKLPGTSTFIRVLLKLPFGDIYDQYSGPLNMVLLFIMLGLVSVGGATLYINNDLHKSLTKTGKLTAELADGNLVIDDIQKTIAKNEDVSIILDNLQHVAEEIHKKSQFTEHLKLGNLNESYTAKTDDKLGNMLIGLRDNLKKNSAEAERRRWTNEGLAHFAEILRGDNSGFAELCNELITEIVKYLHANQGAIFLLETDDSSGEEYLNLTAAYAYERKKFIEKKLEINEGLPGQAFTEKGTIHLTEVPSDYIRITSGLGKAVPGVLLLTPLMSDDDVTGVIEIAGFKPFEPHEIAFVEKLAESISLTIRSAKNNESTRKLLQQSQIQAEDLRSAEEEMRQNMEELQATQEELNRRAGETEELLKSAEWRSKLSDIQIDIGGKLSSINKMEEVYMTVMKEICENLDFDFAFAYKVAFQRAKRFISSLELYHSENEAEFTDLIQVNNELQLPVDQGLLGKAYQEQYPLFHAIDSEEPEEESDFSFDRKEQAQANGFKGLYIFPVFSGSKVTALIEFYSKSEETKDELNLQFGFQLGKMIGEVLARVKLAEASMVKEEEMAKSQFDFRALMDGLPDAVLVLDPDGKIENHNKMLLDLTELKSLEVRQANFLELIQGEVPKFEDGEVGSISIKAGETIKDLHYRSQVIKKNNGERRLLVLNQ